MMPSRALPSERFRCEGQPALRHREGRRTRPWVGKWDSNGMLAPRGVAVTDAGELWVADWEKGAMENQGLAEAGEFSI
jgi:hypothetical protein